MFHFNDTAEFQRPRETVGAPCALLETARSLSGFFDSSAEANEAAAALSAPVVEVLSNSDLFGLFTPRCVGGAELNPLNALRVIETIAYADGSTAWVLFTTGLCIGAAGAYLGEGAVKHLFVGDRIPIMGGQGIPNGKAVIERHGYRLNGAWNYGSGTKHSAFIHTGAIVYEDGKPRLDALGNPEVRIFYVPREHVSFGDNWNVLGLRATGSIDYSIRDEFVEEDYTYPARIVEPKRGGDFYRIGTIGIGAIGHTAFALGVGRRVLDEISALARARTGRPGGIGDSESFLEGFANAEARLRAAKALVYETWGRIEVSLGLGGPLPRRDMTLARLSLNHATWTAAEICAFAYKAAGGVALRAGTLQRFFRDMNSGTQHVTSSPPILRDCGRDLADMAEGKTWGFLGLVGSRTS